MKVRNSRSDYIVVLFEVGRLRIAGAIALMFLLLTERDRIALLLPILQVSGFDLGAQGAAGRYATPSPRFRDRSACVRACCCC